MIAEDETFDGTWPFAPFFFGGCGFKQHYVIEPGPGDPILLLHGEPTWGYLYRHFIPPLSRYGTVVVPDHMGFGKSETPQDRSYLIRDHVDNLEGLIDHLAMERHHDRRAGLGRSDRRSPTPCATPSGSSASCS